MHGLHAIRTVLEAWVWMHAMNGRSTIIGATRWQRDNLPAHLYLLERGQPPPANNRNNWARQDWRPYAAQITPMWASPLAFWMNPACGKLKTQSKFMRGQSASDLNRPFHRCPECIAKVGEGTLMETLRRNDPWTNLDHQQRLVELDPLTGV